MARYSVRPRVNSYDFGYQRQDESPREEYEVISAQIGRYVLAESSPTSQNQETFYEYLDRMQELNEKQGRDIEFIDYEYEGLFVSLVSVQEFTDVVIKSHPKTAQASARKTQYAFNTARRRTREGLKAMRMLDIELANEKFAHLQYMEDDDPYFEVFHRPDSPQELEKWGPQSVVLRPQIRNKDNALGFSLQPDAFFYQATEGVITAMRYAGLREGIERVRLQRLHMLEVGQTSRPIHQIPEDERPIFERPPSSILLGAIELRTIFVPSEDLR